MTLSREKDKEVRRTNFLAFWLSKFLFSEFPGYGLSLLSFRWQLSWPEVPSIL